MDGSTINWCKQNALREALSEDLLYAKIAEPDMVNFKNHFRDRKGKMGSRHLEVLPKL